DSAALGATLQPAPRPTGRPARAHRQHGSRRRSRPSHRWPAPAGRTVPLPRTGPAMTHASTSAHPVEDCGCDRPRPTTPVLLHRNLVPGLDTQALSVFGDDRWDLTPGV